MKFIINKSINNYNNCDYVKILMLEIIKMKVVDIDTFNNSTFWWFLVLFWW